MRTKYFESSENTEKATEGNIASLQNTFISSVITELNDKLTFVRRTIVS